MTAIQIDKVIAAIEASTSEKEVMRKRCLAGDSNLLTLLRIKALKKRVRL